MEASKVTDITNTVNCFFANHRRRLKVKIDKLKWFSSEIQDESSLK
jgi:hypothetical protein